MDSRHVGLLIGLILAYFLSFAQPSVAPPGRTWNQGDSLALAAVCIAAWRTARRPLHPAFYSAYGLIAGVILAQAVWINDGRDLLSIYHKGSTFNEFVTHCGFVIASVLILVRLTPAIHFLLPAKPTGLVCRACGYALRGQVEKRCPECGLEN